MRRTVVQRFRFRSAAEPMDRQRSTERCSARSPSRRKRNAVLRHSLLIAGVSVVLLAWANTAQAASLSLAPATGTFSVGKTFSLRVYAASKDQALNAVSGTITFPPETLAVTAIAKSGSVVSLWVQEPSFSNSAGRVNFEGIVLNPGYTGSGGLLLTVTFRAKAVGSAVVRFSEGSVLANDGAGTEILTARGEARFTFGEAPAAEPAPAVEAATPTDVVPRAPTVSSPTHPDPRRWHASGTATFHVVSVPGTTGASALVDRNPTTEPDVRSVGVPDRGFTYEVSGEGMWYFHLRLRNAHGWGATTHFPFQIDTEAPESFTIQLLDGEETDQSRPRIAVHVRDRTSGIDHLMIAVGSAVAVRVDPENASVRIPYVLDPQSPGRHTVTVRAVDRAGNVTTASEEFSVILLAPPQVIEYPRESFAGEVFVIRGRSVPDARVLVTLTTEAGRTLREEVQADDAGEFTVIWPESLAVGRHSFTAQAISTRGAQSASTGAKNIVVRRRDVLRIGQFEVAYATVFVVLIALVVLLVSVIIEEEYRIRVLRRMIRRKVGSTAGASLRSPRGVLGTHVRTHIVRRTRAREAEGDGTRGGDHSGSPRGPR